MTRSGTTRPPPPPPTPPPPTPFDFFIESNHNHGTGTSNFCTQVRTQSALSGEPGNARLAGPSGAGSRSFTTGPDGRAVVVFPISQFGTYTVDVTVRGQTKSGTYTVGSPQGTGTFTCPAP